MSRAAPIIGWSSTSKTRSRGGSSQGQADKEIGRPGRRIQPERAMGALDALLQRPRLASDAFAGGKARTIVGDTQADLSAGNRQADVDAVRAAVAHRIGDCLAQQLLKVELKTDRDRPLFALGANAAIDRPLLGQPVGERSKLRDRLCELEVAVLAQRGDEASDL